MNGFNELLLHGTSKTVTLQQTIL